MDETQIDPSQGYCIEISVLPDGTYNVSAEPLQQEANEPGESAGQPSQSFDEAIQAAQDLYSQLSGSQDQEQGAELPKDRPTDMAQMWAEEAAKRQPGGGTATGAM
jgi:hypothetical protein